MPSAPQGPGVNAGDEPADFQMAARFGIPVAEYRAWKDGRVPPMPQQNNGGMQGQPAPQQGFPPASGWR